MKVLLSPRASFSPAKAGAKPCVNLVRSSAFGAARRVWARAFAGESEWRGDAA